MGWNSRDEDWQADHYRDERKHDFEPIPRAGAKPAQQFTATEPNHTCATPAARDAGSGPNSGFDSRDGGHLPHRLDVEIPTAVDIAFMVKGLPLMKGAEVIERYLKDTADRVRDEAVRAGAGR